MTDREHPSLDAMKTLRSDSAPDARAINARVGQLTRGHKAVLLFGNEGDRPIRR